jgi:hypothetical protein
MGGFLRSRMRDEALVAATPEQPNAARHQILLVVDDKDLALRANRTSRHALASI